MSASSRARPREHARSEGQRQNEQMLDALLDRAHQAAAGAEAGSSDQGYLRGVADTVAAIRRTTPEEVLADIRRRAKVCESFVTAGDTAAAVAKDELLLHFQPKVSLRGDRVVGMEALVRWAHPRFGLLGPDRFIPVAERGDEIVEVGSCRTVSSWTSTCQICRAWRPSGICARTPGPTSRS
jgi:predicted signal transduction protein with EAL and GGDEF domain